MPPEPWWYHVVWKLLDGDRSVRELFAIDPFDGKAPRWIRIRRFVYRFGTDTWWTRYDEELWLPPISLATPGFESALGEYDWPSPSLR